MINKCNAFFSLLSFKPKVLYRKKEYFTTNVSLIINIFYILTLFGLFIALLYQCYIKRINSISSYYTLLPTNLSMTVQIELLNKTTYRPIENSESILKLTMIESRVNSTELEFTSFSLMNTKKTKIQKPIGSQYTYEENFFLYRSDKHYNTIGIDIELCLNESHCSLTSEKDKILSESILKVVFPTTYYNPMNDEAIDNTKGIKLELGFNQGNDYYFILEPQVVFENFDLGLNSQASKYRQKPIYNNYDFHSLHKTKDVSNNNKYYMHFLLIHYTNIIIISKVSFFCKILPTIISLFYLTRIIFKIIFKYSMEKLYDTDFEHHLIQKKDVIQKNNQKRFFKSFSLLFNNETNTRSHKMNTQTHPHTSQILNNNCNNKTINKVTLMDSNCNSNSINNSNINDITNLNNSRANIISNDFLLKTFKRDTDHKSQNSKKNQLQSIISLNPCDNNNNNNPQTIIRFTPNMPYTFQENQSGQSIADKNHSFDDTNFNGNSIQQIPNENPCLLQPISLNINFNNSNNKINIAKDMKDSIKNNLNDPQAKEQKTFLYKACCCFKVNVPLKDISQILLIRTEIMRYASIDEIVSRLSFYETLLPKMIELIESRKVNEAIINDSDNNNNFISSGL